VHAILAQFGLSDETRVPVLPAAPLIERVWLANPWPIVILLIVLAAATFVVLNARGRAVRGLAIAAAFLLAAVGAYVTSMLVETDREAISSATRELVRATAAADRAALGELLSDDLSMRVTRVPRSADKSETIALIERLVAGQYGVSGATVLECQATLDGPRLGRTHVRVRTTSQVGVLPSWWRIDWVLEDDRSWRARRIEALWIPGVPNPGG